jgi:glycosyltransferase involved in cell wall biosynthesis
MVSVVIPTFNRVEYLKLTIDSILNQTYTDCEVIIVDDGSSDGTKEFVNENYKTAVRYINRGKIGNIAALRNIGITESRGDLIAFCDDDDIWLPGKLQKQLNKIGKYDFVCTNASVIDEFGSLIDQRLIDEQNSFVFDLRKLLFGNLVITSTVLLKKSILANCIFNERSDLHALEDYELWLRLTRHNKMFFLNEPLILYRKHNVSNSQKYSGRKKMLENVLLILQEYRDSGNGEYKIPSMKGQFFVRTKLYKLYKENRIYHKCLAEIFKMAFMLKSPSLFKEVFVNGKRR